MSDAIGAVGVIGLGTMGAPMAANLVRAGFRVVVNDVEAQRAGSIDGVTFAATPAALAAAVDVVVLSLPGTEVVDAVVAGADGVLEGARPPLAIIDTTTNYPPASKALAARCAAGGIGFLDAPVSGGRAGAEAATLSIMCGGPVALFERCRPVLGALGSRLTHLGEEVGAGGYAKLANQIIVSLYFAAVSEGLVFAAKAGLDLERLVPALQAGWAASTVLDVKAPQILARDFRPIGTVAVQHKDLSYITRSMADLGFELPFSPQLQAMYADLIEAGKAGLDQIALVECFEALAERRADRPPNAS